MTTQNNGERPFLFDQNFFDTPSLKEEEEINEEPPPPPPPTFTKEELEAARTTAFEEGKKAAQESAHILHEKEIRKLLSQIAQETKTLISKEQKREERYEYEVIHLSLNIFQKLFPLYQKHFGFEELKSSIASILKKQIGQKNIVISLSPDNARDLEAHIEEFLSQNPEIHISLKTDKNLKTGAFTLSWNDGGAVKDTNNLAEEITALMQQVLASKSANSHDSTKDEQQRAQSHPSSDETNIDNESDVPDNTDEMEKP